jgi:hypothetical protein
VKLTGRQKRGLALSVTGGGLLLFGISRGFFDKILAPKLLVPGFVSSDADWLARIVLTESSSKGRLGPEGVGIAYVAKNRLESGRYGSSIKEVVTGKTGRRWFGAARTAGYCFVTGARLCSGRTRGGMTVTEFPQYDAARAMAEKVMDGTIPNPVGRRLTFHHPGGMKKCPNLGAKTKKLICRSTPYGKRWIPRWGISKAQGGAARTTPITVGAGVFAGSYDV